MSDCKHFIASGLGRSRDGRLSATTGRIAGVSVGVSVAVMIAAISILGGFKDEIRRKATGIMGSVNLVVPGQPPLNELYPFSDSLSYINHIKEIPSVEDVSPVAYRSGLVKTEDNIEGLYFKGVDSLYNLSFFEGCLAQGTLPDYTGRISSDVMISSRTAARLGVQTGDGIVAYFIGEPVKVRKFTVCGLFDAQLEEVDTKFAIADLRQVQRLNGWRKDEVSSLEINLSPSADIDRVEAAVRDIEAFYSSDSDRPLFVTSVKRIFGYLFDWLALLDLNVLTVLLLMIAVSGFNMISSALILLFEKISVIGLLKALGMTSSQVGGVFLYRSAAVMGKGFLWGNVAGIGLCLVQKWLHIVKLDPANYFVPYVPVSINWWQILVLNIAAFALLLLIVSASSLFISKISPARTMRVD
ncbi:MAG: ABC transporter permease [Bacteroidales bacterium]|nr:ABC transporter permease [Candidatus Cacconaster caballi]